MHTPHLIALGGWVVGWVLLWRVPRLLRASEDEGQPVTVVIPARNEARRIRPLLESLEAGLPEGARAIVVDDHSEDETAKIASAFPFVEVVPSPPLPDGWLGKPWACHTGASRASPGVLVFVDADVRVAPDGLRHALATLRKQGGLVSVYPYSVLRRPYEYLSAFFQIISLMTVRCGGLVPTRQAPGVIGTMLLTSTKDLAASGGFEGARADVVEDFALARAYAAQGLPVRVYGGHEDASVRLYPEGLGKLVQGWIKTIASGAQALPVWLMAGVVLWITCSLGAIKWVHGPFRWESGVLYALFAGQVFTLGRQVGSYGIGTALLYPVIALFTAVVFGASLCATFLLGKVRWRDRTIDLRETKARKDADPGGVQAERAVPADAPKSDATDSGLEGTT